MCYIIFLCGTKITNIIIESPTINFILSISKHPFIEILKHFIQYKRVVIQYSETISDTIYMEIV